MKSLAAIICQRGATRRGEGSMADRNPRLRLRQLRCRFCSSRCRGWREPPLLPSPIRLDRRQHRGSLRAGDTPGCESVCTAGTNTDSIFSVTGTITLPVLITHDHQQPDASAGPTGSPGITISGAGYLSDHELSNSCSLTLANLTLSDGLGNPPGGAIIAEDGSLTITDCTFSNNKGSEAGAILDVGSNADSHRQHLFEQYRHRRRRRRD